MWMIECKELSLGYQGIPVCAPLTFSVKEGAYLCIVGENGSGKTTLIKTLLGLIRPLSGEIRWGESLRGKPLGYLPQQVESEREFPATVEEVILSGVWKKGICIPRVSKREKEAAYGQAKKLGITNLWNVPFSHLSGGQKRRALLARALCATDRILLLDEPAAGLDPLAAEELYAAIEELNRVEGVTVIMITHELSIAEQYATSVLHMGDLPVFYENGKEYFLTGRGGEES